MVSKLTIKGFLPKTKERKASDKIHKKKVEEGIIKEEDDEDCDWTVDGSPPQELPEVDVSHIDL